MTPITIRADTPREAVEEVCKWLEERGCKAGDLEAWNALEGAAEALRSATIEPKEPTP